jgi:dolichol-phosphate mannosyltransferase
MSLELSVVVPVCNEAENVARLAEEIATALAGRNFEMIFVDDGSTDTTLATLQQLPAISLSLRILTHSFRAGQSAAVASGVNAALAPWIATLDGDGQNDPADIPKLLRARDAVANKDVRLFMGNRTTRRDTGFRKLQSRVANGVRSRMLGDGTPDTGCGIKVFSRDAFLALPRFDHMHRFLPALFQRQGSRVISVPVSHRPRDRGISKYGMLDRLWVGIVDIFGVMWLRRRYKSGLTATEIPLQ